MNNKRLYIRTFGCQMNVRDSEFVAGILVDNGFEIADSAERADVILFNSCSVRKHAEDKLFSNIGELKPLKRRRPGLIIGLMGCAAQSFKELALQRQPLIDIVCGPGNESDMPQLIRDVLEHRAPLVAVNKAGARRPEMHPGYRAGSFKAFVSIGEGCDNFCSYCIVPHVRGSERSRDASAIVKEVRDLASRGFKEVTLLGQNVNSYGGSGAKGRGAGFVTLLERLNGIEGIARIRFMTSHPKDAHIELFKAMRGLDKVCEHLHLPLQSGSDRILKLMNRKYTSAQYLKLVNAYRKHVPGGSLSTDIIIGFPTETEADFKKTSGIMKKVGFDSAFTFKYSPRPPAKSANLADDVEPAVKARRLGEVIEIQCRSSEARNRSEVGKTVEVLVDGSGRRDASSLSGRTRENRIAVFVGPRTLIGRCVNVTVESVTPYALKGRITA